MNTGLVKPRKEKLSGKLKIGDDWNAIMIIALSQTNPLKAIAEFVENSIDAHARNITVVRGKEKGQFYLQITDDGDGIPKDSQGLPDFKYVATHICDSIKRNLKTEGAQGIQGEFGIGLLSFWIVGEELTITSAGMDGKNYQMRMAKGAPNYSVIPKHTLFMEKGTELKIKPLLSGIRQLSGEKIQWFLASELRDRIRNSGVHVRVIDRHARAEYKVEPRQFTGQLLHQLPTISCAEGEIYFELYFTEPLSQNQVWLYRSGTRVLSSLASLDAFQRSPWNTGYFQGIIDAPFLHLTPGTRDSIILDEAFVRFVDSLKPIETVLQEMIENQKKAEEEKTSHQILRSVQKALKEALLVLPEQEYDWFEIYAKGKGQAIPSRLSEQETDPSHKPMNEHGQKRFFEFAGPLFSVRISPSSCITPVNSSKNLRAIPRDRTHHQVEENLLFSWKVIEGDGSLENIHGEIVTFKSNQDPGLSRIRATVTQGDIICNSEALITITDSLIPEKEKQSFQQGIPGYTCEFTPGELWRSKYLDHQNIVVINSGHRDFVFASRNKTLKLRYICRLFAKELICKNFAGYPADQLLERMLELSLYTEENLR